MILLAPERAMGGIQAWAGLVAEHWDGEPITVVDTSPPRRRPSESLSVFNALLGFAAGAQRWIKSLVLARVRRCGIWATTSPSIGFRVRDVPFLLLAKALRVRVVVHVHGSRLSGLLGDGTRSRSWARLGLRAAHAIVVLDSKTQTELSRFSGREVLKLPNFVPIGGRRHTTDSYEGRLLYVGRVEPAKGSEVLIELAKRLQAPATLTVIGPLAPEIEETFMAEASSAGAKVLGQMDRDGVRSAMEGADLLVLPSHHEGFPMVVLEAMAVGLPVFASDAGACREMLTEGAGEAAGVVLPNPLSHGSGAFVDLLMATLEEVPLSALRGGPGRVAERYSPEKVIPQMRALLKGGPV